MAVSSDDIVVTDDSGGSGVRNRSENGSMKLSEANGSVKLSEANGSVNLTDDGTSSIEGSGEGVALKQTVGLGGGISLIVGVIIGSGIFISPKGIAEGMGSVGLSLIAWGICGVIAMLGALCYAELGTFIKESGGEYAYLKKGFGNILAFLFSWASSLLLKPAGTAIVCMTCSEYILTLFFDDSGCGGPPVTLSKALACAVMVTLCVINCTSVETATSIQIIFTVAKVAALGVIILGGIVKLFEGYTEHLDTGFEGTETDVGKIFLGLYNGMWAYDGWNNLNYVTEEIKNPNKNLPRAILIGVPMVIGIYMMVNVSYFTVMSIDDLLESPAVAVTWAERVMPQFSWVIPIVVAMSTFGGANGALFTVGRLNYVAARDGNMLEILSMVHVTRYTPLPSIIFTTMLSLMYISFGDVGSLIDFFNFAVWTFYTLTMAVLIFMRFKSPFCDMPRPYKVWLPIPIFVMLASASLVIVPIIFEPQIEFLYAFLFIIGGLIFYVPFVHFKLYPPFFDNINCFFQLLYQVSPPTEEPKIF